jgi:diguanylate cyclase (GGDEF)-like protein/PAS domain S-box-containing protein
MPAKNQPEVRVLGQLMLMQSIVASLPDDAIISFVTKGLSDIPGVEEVEFSPEITHEDDGFQHIHLTSGPNFYGELNFKVSDAGRFANYSDHIGNFCFMLAIILDERQQRRIIRHHKEHLEQEVVSRTRELALERDTVRRYLDIARVMLLALDVDGRIMMINRKGAELLGKSESSLVGVDWFDNFFPPGKRNEERRVFKLIISGGLEIVNYYENRIINASGQEMIMAWNNTIIRNEDGVAIGGLSSGEDITLRKQQEEFILHQAHFDNLTDLPNRFLSLDRLSQLLNDAQRNNNLVAVLFMDLDDFKKINDSMGHNAGDRLLVQVAERLDSTVRSGDTVGRLGGDEFIVLLGGLADVNDINPVVKNLLNCFREPFRCENRELMITAAIGIAIYPNDGDTPSLLLRNADSAMYHSKEQGRNAYSYFTEEMNRKVSRRLELEEQMHGALERGEFQLYYQPKIDIRSSKMTGVEALLRWRNPILGDVSPGEFISVAEQTGMIVAIGKYVFTEGLKTLASWQQRYSPDMNIAINLSPSQFRDPNLVSFIDAAMRLAGVSGRHLELELTEGLLISVHSFIGDSLAELKELDIQIAMDDFGKGFSSLSYLRTYPFDTLKIDRDFIDDITRDPSDLKLVTAAIAMSHGLGLKVVAEGVETQEQLRLLASHGCDIAQGYLFSKAVPADEITGMLESEGGARFSIVETT